LGFGELPEELIAWTEHTEWMKDVLEEWKKLEDGNEEFLKEPMPPSKKGRM